MSVETNDHMVLKVSMNKTKQSGDMDASNMDVEKLYMAAQKIYTI